MVFQRSVVIQLRRLKLWDNFYYNTLSLMDNLPAYLYMYFDCNDDNNHSLDLIVSLAFHVIVSLYTMIKNHLKDKDPLTWSNSFTNVIICFFVCVFVACFSFL